MKKSSFVFLSSLVSLSVGITICGINDVSNSLFICAIDGKSIVDSSRILTSDSNGDSSEAEISYKKVQQVALGYKYSAAVTEDGCLYTWGMNTRGQLGNGGKSDKKTPVKIMNGVKSVTLGNEHGAALSNDGSLYLWGTNYYAQIGDGTREARLDPVKIMDNVKSVSLGCSYSAAVSEDNGLYQWGRKIDATQDEVDKSDETDGQYDAVINRTPLRTMEDVNQISLGYSLRSGNRSGFFGENRCAFVKTNGELYLWGDNSHGKLGNGEKNDLIIPVKIMGDIKEIALGFEHNAAITVDGSLYLWGNNYCGQIGNNSRSDQLEPVKVMDNVKNVSLGYRHSAAITEDGSLYMWGDNYNGQLGNGKSGGDITSFDGGVESSTPIKIMDNVKCVSLGYDHSAAITEDGELYLWGDNEYGQLGTLDESVFTYGYNSYATPGHEKTVCSSLPGLINIPEDPPEATNLESTDDSNTTSSNAEQTDGDSNVKKIIISIGALGAALALVVLIRKKM